MEFTRRRLIKGAGLMLGASALGGFPAIAQPRPFRIGVFVSERDAQGVEEMVTPYMDQLKRGAELAVAEINAAGGLAGRPVELFYVNDLGSPPSAEAVTAMVSGEGAEAIVAGFVQASPRLISVRSPSPVPVLSGFWTDGSACTPVTKYTAPTVMQVVPAIRNAIDDALENRPFTIANWTPSGRTVSSYLYGALAGAHTGDALVTTPVLGAHAGDFRGVMRWADDMESNIVWVAEPRPYAVNVVNQAVELGLAEGKLFAYVDFSEIQAAELKPGASVITCLPFVSSDPDPKVQDFVARAAEGGGPVTHVAFTHYNAVMALKAAIEKSGDATAAGALAGFAEGLTLATATGPLAIDATGYATMPLFVARAEGGGGLEVVEKVAPAETGVACR